MISLNNIRDIKEVRRFVRTLLLKSDLNERYKHTLAVSIEMRRCGKLLGFDQDLCEIVGLLHDIGYSNELRISGFHPLDGYNFLVGIDPDIANMMLYHTSTKEEAEMLGLSLPPRIRTSTADLLSYVDSRIDHLGTNVGFNKRLSSIISRYGSEHRVSIACTKAWDRLRVELHYINAALN